MNGGVNLAYQSADTAQNLILTRDNALFNFIAMLRVLRRLIVI